MLFKYLHSTIGETLALCAALLLYPFSTHKLDDKQEGKRAILIHGYLHNESGWKWFRWQLQKGGLGPVDTVSYPSVIYDIPLSSQIVKNKVDEIKQAGGKDPDILIGHSEGGLVALEYALEFAPKDKNTLVITLGSPFHGTHLAKVGVGPAARQLEVGSLYLQGLIERLKQAPHIHLMAIASQTDGIIRPYSSALLPELRGVHNVEFDNLGHLQMIFSKRVVDEVLAYLHSFDGS